MQLVSCSIVLALLSACAVPVAAVAQLRRLPQSLQQPSPKLLSHRKAAERGGASEMLAYGRDMNDGVLGRRNYTEAAKWFRLSAKAGSAEGQSWLGSLYLEGHGVPKDPQKAHDLLLSAAKQKDKVALRFLGEMCETGTVEKQDYSRAFEYYKQASALGDANSFDRRGMLRLNGLGMGKSPKQAFILFTRGATAGDAWSELHLAQMYIHGAGIPLEAKDARPVPQYDQAVYWLKKSALQKNRVAMYVLGRMFLGGSGVKQQPRRAFMLFQLSAARRFAPAQVQLGRMLESGGVVQASPEEAYVAYSLAAEQGSPEGQADVRKLASTFSAEKLKSAQQRLVRYKQISAQQTGATDSAE